MMHGFAGPSVEGVESEEQGEKARSHMGTKDVGE